MRNVRPNLDPNVWNRAILVICLTFLSLLTHRATADVPERQTGAARTQLIEAAVDAFYAHRSKQSDVGGMISGRPPTLSHEWCEDDDPSGETCADAVCRHLGKFGCDDIDEVRRVGQICRGQRSSACLETACSRLGKFGCDSIDEIEQVTRSCRGVRAGCLKSVCTRLGSFGCDSQDEITQVGNVCRGLWDYRCIDSTCDRLGKFGCDDIDEIDDVARSCRGE